MLGRESGSCARRHYTECLIDQESPEHTASERRQAQVCAVIGPNALLSKGISGYYGGNSCNNNYWTMVDAVKQYVNGTVTASGVPSVSSPDTSKIADAVAM